MFFYKNVIFTLKNAARWIVKTTLISSNIIALRNLQSRNGVQDERFSGGLSLASSFSGKGEELREKRKEGYLLFMWGKPEIPDGKSNSTPHPVWEASENMGCDLRLRNFSTLFSLFT